MDTFVFLSLIVSTVAAVITIAAGFQQLAHAWFVWRRRHKHR